VEETTPQSKTLIHASPTSPTPTPQNSNGRNTCRTLCTFPGLFPRRTVTITVTVTTTTTTITTTTIVVNAIATNTVPMPTGYYTSLLCVKDTNINPDTVLRGLFLSAFTL
jgi:hypothetical protein